MTKSLHEEIKSHVRFLIKVLIFTLLPVVTGDLECKDEGFISCLHLFKYAHMHLIYVHISYSFLPVD